MVRVAISDAHRMIRCSVRSVLEGGGEFEVVREGFDGDSTIEPIRSADIRVLTLAMSMPGVHGISLIEQSKFEKPLLRVLVLTTHPEEAYAVRAFKAGASGFLTKASPSADLIDAVKKVASGGIYLSLTMAARLGQTLNENAARLPHVKLTDRELDVFVRIAAGLAITSIAHALSLSTKTVSPQRAHIFAKAEFPHEAALVRYAVQHRLSGEDEDTWAH